MLPTLHSRRAWFAALLLTAPSASAQQPAPRAPVTVPPAIVQGRIVGPDKKGVEEAEILLGDGLHAFTDRRGRFVIDPVPPGVHEVFVRKMGLVPLSFRLAVTPGDIWDGTITMDRSAQSLPTVIVLDSTKTLRNFRPSWLDGFVERRRMGMGTFVDRIEIERARGARTAQLVGRVAGISVQEGPGYDVFDVSRCKLGDGSPGKAVLWVNGLRAEISRNGRFMSLSTVPPEMLLGIEIYRGYSTAPSQFHDSQACLVILLWTR